MEKKELKRRLYVRPDICIVEVDEKYRLLSTSMELNVPGTEEEDWDDEDVEAGEIGV